MKNSNKKIEFDFPDNVIPEGTMEGEDFDLTCTFRSKGKNHVCLVMAGDVELPGYKENAKEDRPSYKKYSNDIMQTGGGGVVVAGGAPAGPNGGGGY